MTEWQPVNLEKTKWEMQLPGFKLTVTENTFVTRFRDAVGPTFDWKIERREYLPSGEERTMEESMAEAMKAFKQRFDR